MSIRKTIALILEDYQFDNKEYLKWKRKNVTIRGMSEIGKYNGNNANTMGEGLYTAPLSNKQIAKEYGDIYFVLGAIPKKPLIVDTLLEWENYLYYKLIYPKLGRKSNRKEFDEITTIKEEMVNKGYDGVIIKGREMVKYNPDPENILFFQNERQLEQYFINQKELGNI